MTALCTSVYNWIFAQGEQNPNLSPSPVHLTKHVATCPECRRVVEGVLTTVLNGCDMAIVDCKACEEDNDIPAFIDLERAEGSQTAAAEYPQTWWLLWTCVECSEDYQRTVTLLAAQLRGHMPLLTQVLQASKPPRPKIREFRLPQLVFSQLFTAYDLLGTTWGDADDESVVFDETRPECHFMVSVQPSGRGLWNIIIRISPPIVNAVTLVLSSQSYNAPVDHDGQARIGPFTQQEIQGGTGAEMVVTLHDQVSAVGA